MVDISKLRYRQNVIDVLTIES